MLLRYDAGSDEYRCGGGRALAFERERKDVSELGYESTIRNPPAQRPRLLEIELLIEGLTSAVHETLPLLAETLTAEVARLRAVHHQRAG